MTERPTRTPIKTPTRTPTLSETHRRRVDSVLENASVLLVTGPGGVGKTTLSAALAARAAAEHGRRALVVTVDPARRLASALGISELTEEPVLVPVPGDGRLWAMMVDMTKSWDALVQRHAPDEQTATALLQNRLYQMLTRRFAQSHDYIALDHLVDLADDDRFDLVIIDTPPSVHALDILDAPNRMVDFFGSRLLKWVTAPYRSRVVGATAKPFLAIAERLLGGEFLAEVAEFFWLFSTLQPDFVRRANVVTKQMHDPKTSYVGVRILEDGPAAQSATLATELVKRGHHCSLWLNNRVIAQDNQLVLPDKLEDSLRQALHHVACQSDAQATIRLRYPLVDGNEADVAWRGGPIHDLESLLGLLA